jgi:hypothetical protein
VTEEWRDVVGLEGLYQVSSHGRVRSLDRVITRKTGAKQSYKGKLLKPALLKVGYLYVNIRGSKAVHRLVLEAFVGPCPEGMECRHLDGTRTNNHLSNLRWGTSSENNQDILDHGTNHNVAKSHCPRGHVLEVPNLRATPLRQGRRGCLSCNRAGAYLQYHGLPKSEYQRVADGYFAKLQAGLSH